MPIHVACNCGRSYQLKEEFAGRRACCSGCGSALIVPHPATSAEEEALAVLLEEAPPPRPAPPRETGISEEEGPRRPPPRPPQLPRSLAAVREATEPDRPWTAARAERLRRSGPSVSVNPSIVTGLLMMLGAAVWFFGGLAAGIIFFYPPILFILGIGTMIKGFSGGD